MALRIQVNITLNPADGSFGCSALYRDTVTHRWSSVGYTQQDPGGTTTSVRNTILSTLVAMCNSDNATGTAGETTNATVSDIVPNG